MRARGAERRARPARSGSAWRRALGLSSGTSADGMDAALVRVRGAGRATSCRLEAFACFPYPEELRGAILRAGSGARATAGHFAHLDGAVGECFAQAALWLLEKAGRSPREVAFVGSHGQTIAHLPQPRRRFGVVTGATWQIGSLSIIAERTGITTVGNFRARDVAVGGEGAPILPYVDWILFGSRAEGRVLLNIGGIANVTFLPRACGAEDVIAFDVGPGNMVIDGLVARLTRGKMTQDTGGVMASRGKISTKSLGELLTDPFFDRPPPRSTGREAFGARYVDALLKEGRRRHLSPHDLVATATALTACAISQELARWVPAGEENGRRQRVCPARAGRSLIAVARRFPRVFISGGGGDNPFLREMLGQLLRPMRLAAFDELGLPSRAREAVSFAILANECLAGNPANLPQVTGAAKRVVLGEVAWRDRHGESTHG